MRSNVRLRRRGGQLQLHRNARFLVQHCRPDHTSRILFAGRGMWHNLVWLAVELQDESLTLRDAAKSEGIGDMVIVNEEEEDQHHALYRGDCHLVQV